VKLRLDGGMWNADDTEGTWSKVVDSNNGSDSLLTGCMSYDMSGGIAAISVNQTTKCSDICQSNNKMQRHLSIKQQNAQNNKYDTQAHTMVYTRVRITNVCLMAIPVDYD